MNATVPGNTILVMATFAILCLVVPFFLIIRYRNIHKQKVSSALKGAAIYVLFAIILENITHIVFLSGKSPIIQGVWPYVIYVALTAAVFEETGRVVAFRFFMKKDDNTPRNAMMYGVGHGGLECLFLGSATLFNNVTLAVTINNLGIQGYLDKAALSGDRLAKQTEALLGFVGTPTSQYMLSGSERLMVLAAQIGLSVLIYYAVTNEKLRFLYPVAIVLHVLLNMPAALYQKHFLTNIPLAECLIAAMAIIIIIIAYRLFQKYKGADE